MRMRRRYRLMLLVVTGLFILVSLSEAAKPVARIVGGEEGCSIVRKEKGVLKDHKAAKCEKLFPGDILHKKKGIDTVRIEFMPYAEAETVAPGTKIKIKFNPPKNKQGIFAKIKEYIGFAKPELCPVKSVTKSTEEIASLYLPGENATVLAGRRTVFTNPGKGGEILFKEPGGTVICRKETGAEGIGLTPAEIGMEPAKIYTWELRDKEKTLYRSRIRLLGKADKKIIQHGWAQIDGNKTLNADEKLVHKAAYLHFLSDMYPGEMNLFWLSYQILKDQESGNNETQTVLQTFRSRALNHLEGEISERDFAMLEPGRSACFVEVEREENGGRGHVSPGVLFRSEERIRFHFQVNFEGYLVILYEDKGGPVAVFPATEGGCKIKPGTGGISPACKLDWSTGTDNYVFILSRNPMVGTGYIRDWQRGKGKKLKVDVTGRKALVTPSQKDLEGMAWFRIGLKHID